VDFVAGNSNKLQKLGLEGKISGVYPSNLAELIVNYSYISIISI
jgi:hypothetical protein